MPTEIVGAVETLPEIRVEISGVGPSGPAGPPGDSPYVGENGNWWVGEQDTGVPASGGEVALDHKSLSGRDGEDQHPVEAITGLKEALDGIPPPVEPITNEEMEELLK